MTDRRHDPAGPGDEAEDRPAVRRRPDASMSLLTEVINHPLDAGYQEAAERRAREARLAPPGTAPRRRSVGLTAGLVVVAIALGLLTTGAVMLLRTPQPSTAKAREVLIAQITERGAEVDRLRQANAQVAQDITGLQEAALADEGTGLVEQLAADSLTSGLTPVTGPGLRVTLQDADVVDTEDDPDSRVQDTDLQVVVNGLWAAGAEAIAVNGQRLTATTAIRSAGDAILVDVVPLVGPYVVEAIGDPQDLQTGLARTSAGQLLGVLQSTYGIPTSVSSQRKLSLAGAATATVRSAQVPEGTPLGGDQAVRPGAGYAG